MNVGRARVLSLAFLLLICVGADAENMLMTRVPMPAELVIEYLNSSIEEHGYTIAHTQLCDGGMTDFGYRSDLYRVVFFGKIAEARMISERYPELVSYLPLKIAVIAEKDETLLAVLNPEALAPFFADQDLQVQFARWNSDLISIFEDVRRSTARRMARLD